MKQLFLFLFVFVNVDLHAQTSNTYYGRHTYGAQPSSLPTPPPPAPVPSMPAPSTQPTPSLNQANCCIPKPVLTPRPSYTPPLRATVPTAPYSYAPVGDVRNGVRYYPGSSTPIPRDNVRNGVRYYGNTRSYPSTWDVHNKWSTWGRGK